MTTETPNTVHGRLLEAAHIAGYSFKRASDELAWLLEEDRWKQLGFADGAAFGESVYGIFSDFKASVEERKPIVKKLTQIMSQRAAAKVLGVGVGTINRALDNVPSGTPEIEKTAENIVHNAEVVPDGTLEWFQDDKVDPVKLAKKQTVRNQRAIDQAARDEGLAAKSLEWPEGRYPVLYADPPWQYEHPPIGATNRSIENHYPTMTLDEICALDVARIAMDDAVLFLWATAPKLAECMDVIKAWDFTYRTCMVWVKDKIGMGYHVRNQHEILLISKRGEFAPPLPENRPSSVLQAPRTEHSMKPLEFYDLIERMYPGVPKVELFARNPREGWARWGNQADAA